MTHRRCAGGAEFVPRPIGAPNQLDRLLHPHDQRKILSAVEAAERRTSAEFKVHVEGSARHPHARAHELFRRLKVERTDEDNGILLFLTVHDRHCLIVAGHGLQQMQTSRAWHDIVHRLMVDLRHGQIGQGVADAIMRLSLHLAARFPRGADDVNEVHDDISTADAPPELARAGRR